MKQKQFTATPSTGTIEGHGTVRTSTAKLVSIVYGQAF
jgi:hypothetical protein